LTLSPNTTPELNKYVPVGNTTVPPPDKEFTADCMADEESADPVLSAPKSSALTGALFDILYVAFVNAMTTS